MIFFPLFLLGTAQAQDYQVGFSLGAAFYQGDMTKGLVDFEEFNVAYGLFFRRHVSDKWAARVNWSRGKLSGDDRNSNTRRGFRFNSTFNEFSLLVEYNLIGGYTYSYGRGSNDFFGLYLMGGGALATLNAKLASKLGEQEPIPEFTDVTLSMPLGGGMRFNIGERTSIEGEFGGRITLTDRIDGIQSGARDYYFVGGINVTLILGDY